MPIHAVLFDLGGTLLDTSDPIGWAATAATIGQVVDPDHLAHAYREVDGEVDAEGLPGSLEEFWRRVLERATGSALPEATGPAFVAEWNRAPHAHPAFSDARYCLETLQGEGLALGIVSNSQGEASVRARLEAVGLLRFFGPIVSSGTEGVRKPDPEIFRRALLRLQLPAAAVVYVGDLAHTDAKAATAVGMHGVWLNRYGWGFGDDPPEITSLTELPGYVRGLPRDGLK